MPIPSGLRWPTNSSVRVVTLKSTRMRALPKERDAGLEIGH
jgi:hypothetical protein